MKKILLVSEKEEYEEELKLIGHEILVAFNPSQARILLKQKPDVIIIDAHFLFVKETAKFVGRLINDYEYFGPIIVIAKEEKSRLFLLKAGCQYEAKEIQDLKKIFNIIFKP